MDAACLARLVIARRSPFTPKDTKSRCEECQQVLTDRDFRSFWDGDPVLEAERAVPRICEDCAEEAECRST